MPLPRQRFTFHHQQAPKTGVLQGGEDGKHAYVALPAVWFKPDTTPVGPITAQPGAQKDSRLHLLQDFADRRSGAIHQANLIRPALYRTVTALPAARSASTSVFSGLSRKLSHMACGPAYSAVRTGFVAGKYGTKITSSG